MKLVSLEDFDAHISRMHADRDKWFEMEYNVSALLSLASPNLCLFDFWCFFRMKLLGERSEPRTVLSNRDFT